LPSFSPSPNQADTTQFNCSINGTDATNTITIANSIGDLGTCKYNVKVPVLQSAAQPGSGNLTALQEAIDGGFMLGWDANNRLCDGCKATGGQCGYNTSTSDFACYCANGTFPLTCSVSTTTGKYFVVFLTSFLAYLFSERESREYFSSLWTASNFKSTVNNISIVMPVLSLSHLNPSLMLSSALSSLSLSAMPGEGMK
jgi:hypothetical protein